MIVGYARISAFEADDALAAQVRTLGAAGAARVMSERTTSTGPRPQLERALACAGIGDTLIVATLASLGPFTAHVARTVDRLRQQGTALRVLDLGLDTATLAGTVMAGTIGELADFNRSIGLERQREGIARAKAAGRYRGRRAAA